MGMFGQGQFVCQFQGQPLESPDVRASREQGPPSRVPLKTAKGLSCQSVPRPHRQRDSAVSPLARAARYSPRLAPGRWGRLRRLQRFAQKLLGVSRAVSSPQVGPDFERGLLCYLPFSCFCAPTSAAHGCASDVRPWTSECAPHATDLSRSPVGSERARRAIPRAPGDAPARPVRNRRGRSQRADASCHRPRAATDDATPSRALRAARTGLRSLQIEERIAEQHLVHLFGQWVAARDMAFEHALLVAHIEVVLEQLRSVRGAQVGGRAIF